jgi:hypothetical protein
MWVRGERNFRKVQPGGPGFGLWSDCRRDEVGLDLFPKLLADASK